MRTQVAAIYGTVSGILQRVIDPSSDDDLPKHRERMAPGESMLVMLVSDVPNIPALQAALIRHIGFTPDDGIAAVLNKDQQGRDVVEATVICDTNLYPAWNGKRVVKANSAVKPGMTYTDAGGFKEVAQEVEIGLGVQKAQVDAVEIP